MVSRYQVLPGQRRRFAQPTVQDVRVVDPVLQSLSIGFRNPRYFADELAAPVRVEEQSGTYFIWTRDFWFRQQGGAVRAPEGPYLRTGYGVSSATFRAIERGFEKLTGRVVQAASQTPESLPQVDVQFLTNLMELEVELDVAAAAFITGVWGTSPTLAGGKQWSDFANSNPIVDVDTAKRTIRRNTGSLEADLFIGALTWEALKEHPLLIEKYKHTQVGILTQDMVASALGVGRIVVGESVKNTAAEGASFVGADCWTDNALVMARSPASGLGVPGGAKRFIWPEGGAFPWATGTYYDEPRRSDVARIFAHWDTKITSAQHGYILLDTNA